MLIASFCTRLVCVGAGFTRFGTYEEGDLQGSEPCKGECGRIGEMSREEECGLQDEMVLNGFYEVLVEDLTALQELAKDIKRETAKGLAYEVLGEKIFYSFLSSDKFLITRGKETGRPVLVEGWIIVNGETQYAVLPTSISDGTMKIWGGGRDITEDIDKFKEFIPLIKNIVNDLKREEK